ncbi:MAG: BolA family transcriptional regulator [Rhodocyclaceae bacterium]|nr:BolA family transcriptional regulator [Rhodocyclaceae bacterium]
MTSTLDDIRHRLEPLAPTQLTVEDESALHAGHVGSLGGGGHFRIRIVSPRFEGKTPIERHRMVHTLLQGLLPEKIHALAIDAHAP